MDIFFFGLLKCVYQYINCEYHVKQWMQIEIKIIFFIKRVLDLVKKNTSYLEIGVIGIVIIRNTRRCNYKMIIIMTLIIITTIGGREFKALVFLIRKIERCH